MSKIVQAVNAMISNPEKITNIARSEKSRDAFYFEYDSGHIWCRIWK